MGILQGVSIFGTISEQLLRMAENSFNKEKKLYNKIGKNTIKIERIEDLTPVNCKKIFDSILNVNSDIFEPLRDEKFYYGITTKIKNTITKQDINTMHSRKKSELFKTKFKQSLEKNLQNNINNEDMAIVFINTFLDQVGFDNSKNKKIDASKIKKSERLSIKDNKINIILTAKNSEDAKIIDFINDENGIKINNFQWNKQDTFDFIALIQTETGQTILSHEDNLQLRNLSIEDVDIEVPATYIYNVFINYFNEYKDLKTYLKAKKDNIINTLQNNATARDLLLGNKKINKVKGDVGEFLVGIMLQAALVDNINNENIYQGKVQTGFGEHAVDIYIKGMGFQVKNFPGQEQEDIVMLYASHSSLSRDSKLQDSDKYLSKEEKSQLRLSVFLSNNIETNNLLLSSLSKFMRIDSNYKETEKATKEILKQAQKMENCFYIVNFRLIPASRLLWEMAQNIKKYKNIQYSDEIQYMFCIDKNNIKNSNLPLYKFYNENIVNIFKDSALYFRGIPLRYNNIKLETTKKNFLADVFKIDYYKY